MAVVASLHLYPVKSCAGIDLDAAVLGRAGLETQGIGDREWMVVTPAGDFLTQRQHPRMALVVPRIEEGALVLSAPGMDELRLPLGEFALRAPSLQVKVWNHACAAFDEGDAAAAWCSDFLQARVRLARFDPAHRRLSNPSATGGIEALNRFSDGYPLLAISTASLDLLNDRLMEAGRERLPMNRFRPNVVVAELGPHDEDRVVSLQGRGYALRAVKPCPRCPIPSIDQSTGVRGDDPLDILSVYRGGEQGILFGQNMIAVHAGSAHIARGDALEEEWSF